MNRFESLSPSFFDLSHCKRWGSTSMAAGGGARREGGLNPWRIWDHGPDRAFARKIAKLNTKGPPQGGGGLNL